MEQDGPVTFAVHETEEIVARRKAWRAMNRRRFGRFAVRAPKCNLGRLLDLSADGARVKSMRSLFGLVTLQLPGFKKPVLVPAKVIWRKRSGLLSFEYGLHFADLTPEQIKAIRLVTLSPDAA
jgi:hypothetical protein